MGKNYSAFKYGDGTKYGASTSDTSAEGDLVWKFLVDWDRDGILDSSQNEADYAVDISIFRGRHDYLKPGGRGFDNMRAGRAVLIMDDPDHRYDPYNDSSPLSPNVAPGCRMVVWVEDRTTSTLYPLFAGVIDDIRPVSGRARSGNRVKIECRDYTQWFNDQVLNSDEALLFGVISGAADGAFQKVIFESKFNQLSDIDADTQPVHVMGYSGRNAGQLLHELANSALGTFFTNKDGRAVFYARDHTGQPSHSIGQSQVEDEILVNMPWDYIGNDVTVVAHRKAKKWLKSIWFMTSATQITNGATVTFDVSYKPSIEVILGDLKVNTQQDGEGTDITENIATSVNLGNTGGTVQLTNTSGRDGWVIELNVKGREIVDLPTEYTDTATAAEIDSYGKKVFRLDEEFLQDGNYADAFKTVIKDLIKTPRKAPQIKMRGRWANQFNLELMDDVVFTSTSLGIADTFRVLGLEHKWLDETGQDVRTTVYMDKVIYDTTEITPEPIDDLIEPPDDWEEGPPDDEDEEGEVEPPPPPPPEPGEVDTFVGGKSKARMGELALAPNVIWFDRTGDLGAVIDIDVEKRDTSKNNAIAITRTSIFITSDLQNETGSPTWEESFTSSTDPDFANRDLSFNRCIAPYTNDSGKYRVAGSALTAAGGTNRYIYVFGTNDNGANWWVSAPIPEEIAPAASGEIDYTVEVDTLEILKPSTSTRDIGVVTVDRDIYIDEDTAQPWASGYWFDVTKNVPLGYGNSPTFFDTGLYPPNNWVMDIQSASDTGFTGDANTYISNKLDTAGKVTAEEWLDDYFGAGNYTMRDTSAPFELNEANRVNVGFLTNAGGGAGPIEVIHYTFWRRDPPLTQLNAFAISERNEGVVYVGTPSNIWRSTNGGRGGWAIWIAQGARDIHAPRRKTTGDAVGASNTIAFWGEDGNLYATDNQLPGSAIMSETPNSTPMRIHADPDYFWPLWVITTNTAYKIPDPTTTTAVGGSSWSSARGLKVYTAGLNRKIMFVDETSIQLINEDGDDFDDITANWTSFANGLNIIYYPGNQ